MMFAIDLLKGKALPEKIDPKKSAFRALLIVLPVLGIILLAGTYQHEKASAQSLQKELNQQQEQIDQYSQDVAEYTKVNTRIKNMDQCLNEIGRGLKYRIKVSEILAELVQNLPEKIFLYEMKLNRETLEKKVKVENSNIKKLCVQRQLDLVLCGYESKKSDRAVQEYLNRLEQSPLLSEIFTDFKPSARQQGEVDNKSAIYYEIECVLREQE